MNDLSPTKMDNVVPLPKGLAGPVAGIRELIDQGVVVGAKKQGGKRFWTRAEQLTIEKHFPAGGVPACLPLLPGRTAGAIYQMAQRLGVRVLGAEGEARPYRRYEPSEQIDDAIRRAFSGKVKLGVLKRLAQTTGRPRSWLGKRALALGFNVPRFKEPDWSEEELAVLRETSGQHPDTVRRRLKRMGYRRTSTAVHLKRKEMRLAAGTDEGPETYSSVALAEAFGVTRGTVTGWVEKGWLAGARQRARGPDTLGQEAHDKAVWAFTRREVRDFVVDSVGVIDFTKVDKFWLVALLTEPAK